MTAEVTAEEVMAEEVMAEEVGSALCPSMPPGGSRRRTQ